MKKIGRRIRDSEVKKVPFMLIRWAKRARGTKLSGRKKPTAEGDLRKNFLL